MKTLIRLSIAITACLAALPADAQKYSIHKKIEVYRETVLMPPDEVERCVHVMRDAFRIHGQTLETSAYMRDRDCLDAHSSVVVPSGAPVPIPLTELARIELKSDSLWIRIFQFDERIKKGIIESVRSIPAESLGLVGSVIVDLRSDYGGSVNALEELLDVLFSPEVGVRYLERETTVADKFRVTKYVGIMRGKTTAILVDGYSASASERMAATIRSWYPATSRIYGTPTYGKNTIQCAYAEMLLTCGHWTHNGKRIKGWVTPDVPVDFSQCKEDFACLTREAYAAQRALARSAKR